MNDAPLIDIRNATIYRGTTRVFDNFSLTIEQHEQVAILGPNGSGKTTLLKVVNREIYPVLAEDSLKSSPRYNKALQSFISSASKK